MYKDTFYDTIQWINDEDPEDVRWIPRDPENEDYKTFLAWENDGGVITPPDPVPEPPPPPNVIVVDEQFASDIAQAQTFEELRNAIIGGLQRAQ